jgi:hypothetical protein
MAAAVIRDMGMGITRTDIIPMDIIGPTTRGSDTVTIIGLIITDRTTGPTGTEFITVAAGARKRSLEADI